MNPFNKIVCFTYIYRRGKVGGAGLGGLGSGRVNQVASRVDPYFSNNFFFSITKTNQ